jgi:hypothetical protein
MPVEDIVKNHELLAKVMSHYRHKLEHVHEDAEIKNHMSNAMRENLSFNHTVKQIEQILSVKGGKSTEEAKKYVGILTIAISQYAKDLEAVLGRAKDLVPELEDGDLHRLESELKAVKAYVTK